jgi:hypothetical protein
MDTTTDTTVSQLLEQYATGEGVSPDLFSRDATLDATVPNWRMAIDGAEQVAAQLSGWFADPGTFESLHRFSCAGGEVVEFDLTWEEQGVPHACHQTHHIDVVDDRIVAIRAWCGGRWPAELLAEMEAANMASA